MKQLETEWDKHTVEVTKDIADISEQKNKQFMEMSQQVADIA